MSLFYESSIGDFGRGFLGVNNFLALFSSLKISSHFDAEGILESMVFIYKAGDVS